MGKVELLTVVYCGISYYCVCLRQPNSLTKANDLVLTVYPNQSSPSRVAIILPFSPECQDYGHVTPH